MPHHSKLSRFCACTQCPKSLQCRHLLLPAAGGDGAARKAERCVGQVRRCWTLGKYVRRWRDLDRWLGTVHWIHYGWHHRTTLRSCHNCLKLWGFARGSGSRVESLPSAEAVEGDVPPTAGMQQRNLQEVAFGVLVLAAYEAQLGLVQRLLTSLWRRTHTFLVHVDLKSEQLERKLREWSASDPKLANVHVPRLPLDSSKPPQATPGHSGRRSQCKAVLLFYSIVFHSAILKVRWLVTIEDDARGYARREMVSRCRRRPMLSFRRYVSANTAVTMFAAVLCACVCVCSLVSLLL